MVKTAFVSEKNGELTLGVIRDANPRMLIGIDLGLPTMPNFTLELPFPEDEAINANKIFNAGLAILVEQFHIFLNERGFVENDIIDTINSLYQTLETHQQERPEEFNEGDPGEVVEVKFPLTVSFWDQIQQHEVQNKVAGEYVNHAKEFELRLQQRDQNQKAKEEAYKAISQFKNNIYKNSPGQLFVTLYDRFGKPSGVARVTNQGLTKFAEPNILDNPKQWIAEKKAMMAKVSYVVHCPGHKNSKGEAAPWCIKSHETGKIISSHKSKAEAKKHLQEMHIFKNSLFNRDTFNFGPTLNSNKPLPLSYHGDFTMEDEDTPFLESPNTKVRKSGSLVKRAVEDDVPESLLKALGEIEDDIEARGSNSFNDIFDSKGNERYPGAKENPTFKRIKTLRELSGLPLPILGEGSSRVVFKINEHSILKLAKNVAGVAQNKAEYRVYKGVETCSMITQIFYYAADFEWLICERAVREPSHADFECYGAEKDSQLVRAARWPSDAARYVDMSVDPDSVKELTFLIEKLHLLPADMSGRNWGIVERDGQEYPVLVDYGFDREVRNKHYSAVEKEAAEIIETDQGEGTPRKITLTLDSKFGSWLITLDVDPAKEFILGTAEVGDKNMRVRGKDGREIEQDLKAKIDWHYTMLRRDLKKTQADYTYHDLEIDNARLVQEMLFNIESYLGPEQPKTRW